MSRRLRRHRTAGLGAFMPSSGSLLTTSAREVRTATASSTLPCDVRSWPAALKAKTVEEYTEGELAQVWQWCTGCAGTGTIADAIRNAMCAGVAARLPESTTGVSMTEAERTRAGTTRTTREATAAERFPWVTQAFRDNYYATRSELNDLIRNGKELVSGGKDCRFNTGMIEFDVPCTDENLLHYIWRRDIYERARDALATLATAPPSTNLENRKTWLNYVVGWIEIAEDAAGAQVRWYYPAGSELGTALGGDAPLILGELRPNYGGHGGNRMPLPVAQYLKPLYEAHGVSTVNHLGKAVSFVDWSGAQECIQNGSANAPGTLDFTSVFKCYASVPRKTLFDVVLARTGTSPIPIDELVGEGGPLFGTVRVDKDNVDPIGPRASYWPGDVRIEALRRWAKFLAETSMEVLATNMAAPRYLNAFIHWGESIAEKYGKTFDEVTGVDRAALETMAREYRDANAAAIAAGGAETLASLGVIGAVLGLIGTVLYGWFFDLVGYKECPAPPPIFLLRTLKVDECNFDPNTVSGRAAYDHVVDAGRRVGLAFPDAFRRVPPGTGDDAAAGTGVTKGAFAFGLAALVGAGVAYLFA